MSDIKLFRIQRSGVKELDGQSVAIEKSLQSFIEKNLEAVMGVNFLATEYSTGPSHGGRIDTLGIDENNCPVIIEYKRSLNENVINQGLYYLDWLMDHKAEFELLVLKKKMKVNANDIEWSAPRLICIAGDYTKFDEHAVQQMNRNIELLRYKKFGDELFLIELVNAKTVEGASRRKKAGKSTAAKIKTVTDHLKVAKPGMKDRYNALRDFLLGLGPDVQEKTLKHYIAFKRIKNFCCIEIHNQTGNILVYVKVTPTKKNLKKGFTRDVRKIGHFGTGSLEITIGSVEDLEDAKKLLVQSYEAS